MQWVLQGIRTRTRGPYKGTMGWTLDWTTGCNLALFFLVSVGSLTHGSLVFAWYVTAMLCQDSKSGMGSNAPGMDCRMTGKSESLLKSTTEHSQEKTSKHSGTHGHLFAESCN